MKQPVEEKLPVIPPVGTKVLYRDDLEHVIEGAIKEQTYTGKPEPGIVPKDYFVIELKRPDCRNMKVILLPKRCYGCDIDKDKSTPF